MSPRVSIVMSAYNDAADIRPAIESLRAQTFTDWELIVVDDGSNDGTGSILDSLALSDSRIHVIHQENQGLTRALIRGCAEAAGEYIARQDADDRSHSDRLARQVAILDSRPDVGFVSCATRFLAPNGELLETQKRSSDPDKASSRLITHREGPPAHGSVMFRKSLYNAAGGYRSEFYFGQDSDLWLRMIEHAKIGYAEEALYDFRVHEGSITGRYRPMQQRFGALGHLCRESRLKRESEQPHLDEARELTQRIVAERITGTLNGDFAIHTAYRIGSQLAVNGDRRAAGYLWRVIRSRPWHWRAWVRLAQSQIGPKRTETTEASG